MKSDGREPRECHFKELVVVQSARGPVVSSHAHVSARVCAPSAERPYCLYGRVHMAAARRPQCDRIGSSRLTHAEQDGKGVASALNTPSGCVSHERKVSDRSSKEKRRFHPTAALSFIKIKFLFCCHASSVCLCEPA